VTSGSKTKPPFSAPAKDMMARSMSAAFSTRIGTGSIPSDGAAASPARRK